MTADLNAAVDYASKLPAWNGHVAVAGFCWGGGQSFRYATDNPAIKTYEPVTYEGAGHGFMRAGEAPDANEG